ncbi:hypothetical protein CC2G_009908 [Coprinopsis cinerea AmutBmut pab1-1]|nr:hypothetical protein CC2G_009908 [Coprinopsis cinerea AmutBmut pab1-1]
MITFYDIPSTTSLNSWSPNGWKTRYTLNFKGLPYKTEWVEYPDIAALYQKNNVPAPAKQSDGSPYYSLPLIHDSKTNTFVADSLEIAKYLDKTYPDTPKVLPDGEEGLAKTTQFLGELGGTMFPLFPIIFPATVPILNEVSKGHFKVARAKNLVSVFNNIKSIDEIQLSEKEVEERWEQVRAGFQGLDSKFGGEGKEFAWFAGDKITFADLALGGMLLWIKLVWGEESAEWKRVSGWNNGKWATMLKKLEAYHTVA